MGPMTLTQRNAGPGLSRRSPTTTASEELAVRARLYQRQHDVSYLQAVHSVARADPSLAREYAVVLCCVSPRQFLTEH